MPDNRLKPFEGEEYLNLETFRKSGAGVPTPVWFAERGGHVYVYSVAEAGKVKRIRNNPRVRIAPCGFRGALKGDWVEARARIVAQEEEEAIHGLLDRKYGWKRRIGTWYSKLIGRKRAVIDITLA